MKAAVIAEKATRKARVLALVDEYLAASTVIPSLGQTLLGQAADAADLERATDLVEQIEDKTAPPWQLDTTDKDLQMSIALIKDDGARADFGELVERLRAI